MVFSKSFPKQVDGSLYPEWIEVFLTEKEELFLEQQAKQKNKQIMKECMQEAIDLLQRRQLEYRQGDVIKIATALFTKRASHDVFWKERKCKDKFHYFVHKNGSKREKKKRKI